MKISFDILDIGSRAKDDAKKGNIVINGCVGTFKDDLHNLITFPSVNKYLTENALNFLDYAPIFGSLEYRNSVLKWVFNEDYEEISKNNDIFVAATIGGTGAIFSIFKEYAEENGGLVISNICWPNYFTISKECNLKTFVYPLFLNKTFNMTGLEEAIKEGLKTKDKLIILINDPCQNPTGLSLTEEEYRTLFSLVKKYNTFNKDVDLLFDIAYFDYSEKKPILLEYLKSKSDFNIYIAFSASKSFGIYGLRCGALIYLAPTKERLDVVKDEIESISRGTISSPNNDATSTLAKLFSDSKAVAEMRSRLIDEKRFLKNRAIKALSILRDDKIDYLPYNDGFFITIITKTDAYALALKLEAMHIYLAPISSGLIRIAICSLSVSEFRIISNAIRNFDN